MNNEPVAWMDEINTFVLDTDYKQFPKSLQNGMIPLYTHPVKELTLTDDEAMDLWNEASSHPIDFARAILRKAQEKC